jgi:hypothetical protein
MDWGWGVIRGPAPRLRLSRPRGRRGIGAVTFLKAGSMKCKRNRYCDQHRDQGFLAESLATGSSIPVAISEMVLSVLNAVANEVGLMCRQQ